jgi:hypothetical protein
MRSPSYSRPRWRARGEGIATRNLTMKRLWCALRPALGDGEPDDGVGSQEGGQGRGSAERDRKPHSGHLVLKWPVAQAENALSRPYIKTMSRIAMMPTPIAIQKALQPLATSRPSATS